MTCSLTGIITLLLLMTCWVPGRVEADELLEQRRQRLENMSDAEKNALLQKKRIFDRLSEDEQNRLRKFSQRLEAAENRERLQQVLKQYDQWLKSFSPSQRAQLLELETDERIDRIKEMLREQETQRFRMMVGGRLAGKDLQVIRTWLDQFIRDHEEQILAALPKDRVGDFLDSYDSKKHQGALPFLMFRYQSPEMPRPSPADEARLQQMVSRAAREVLDSVQDAEERSRILQTWIRAASFSRQRPPVPPEELDKFATTRLDPRQRERLESLPRERMYQELRGLYHRDRFRRLSDNGNWPPFPGPPSGPPDQRRGRRFRSDHGPPNR